MDWFAQQETLFLAVFLQKKHLETFLGKLELCYWQTTMDIFYLELSGLLMIHPKKYDTQSRTTGYIQPANIKMLTNINVDKMSTT